MVALSRVRGLKQQYSAIRLYHHPSHSHELSLIHIWDRLDDLQYLVNRMIQRKMEDAPRVKVDCDHYRERNEARLLEKARSLAERVQESGKPMKMCIRDRFQAVRSSSVM